MSYERVEFANRLILEKVPALSQNVVFAQQLQRLVGFASRLHLISMTCLVKSLALQKILSRRNIPARVKIGVQKIQDELFAHAWVEVNGVPIGEVDDIAGKFNVLESIIELNTHQFM